MNTTDTATAHQLQQFAQGMRAEYRAAIPLAGVPDPVGKVEDFFVPAAQPARAIPVRLYAPLDTLPGKTLPIIVFAHGGGWVSGDFDTHDVLVRTIANRAQALVLAVAYRLAPEAPYPAGLNDMYAVLEWAAAHAAQIGGDATRMAVCGDSAGGNLSAALALLARDREGPAIAAQWLMYPSLDNTFASGSWQQYGDTHFPTRQVMTTVQAAYAPHPPGTTDPLVTPMLARLDALPPALVQVGELDPLQDEGYSYAYKLTEAGMQAQAIVYGGQTHGFMQFYKDRESNPKGDAAIDEGVAFLQAAFNAVYDAS